MNKNHNLFIFDNMFAMGAYWICSGTFVAALTSYHDIPLGIANILTSVTATLTLLQMPGAMLFSRAKSKMTYLYITNLAFRILMPFVFLSVLFTQNVGALIFCIALVLMVSFMHFSAPAQTAWMVNSVQGKAGPKYYSVREMSFMFFHITLFCVNATVLTLTQNTAAEKNGFVLIGSVISVVILISIAVLFKMPLFNTEAKNMEKATAEGENTAQVKKTGDNAPRKHKKQSAAMRTVFKNKAFMSVLITSGMWSFSNMFVGSFAPVYQVRMLQLPFLDILIWTTVGGLLRGASAPLVQKLAMRVSWQRVVQVSIFTMALCAVGWFFITPLNKNLVYPILSILGSVPFAGLSVGFLQLQVDSMGENADRTLYFSSLATVNGVCSLAGSLVCSGIIGYMEAAASGTDIDLRSIFVIGILFMVAAILLAQRISQHGNVQKNKLKEAINAARLKYPGAIGEPIVQKKRYVIVLNKMQKYFKNKK